MDLSIKNSDVLPEIFMLSSQYFDGMLTDLREFYNKVMQDADLGQKLINFFLKYNNYIAGNYALVKNPVSDICVSLKAFGDKLGAVGGETFAKVKENTDAVVAAAGTFFEFVSNFVVNSKMLVKNNNKTLEYNKANFDNLYGSVYGFLTTLTNCFKELATYSYHLYGDAKFVLAERFEGMSNGLINFIKAVKTKYCASIANFVVGAKVMYFNFAQFGYVQQPYTDIYVIDPNGNFDVQNAGVCIDNILTDFEAAKLQAKKALGIE